jgi:8-amino-7-oxononanoate synthase
MSIDWIMESAPGPETTLNGRRYLYFAGTGYLGMQSHPEVIAAAQAAAAQYGVHSATSRTGMGTTPLLVEVERLAAEYFGTEAALYLMSGYAGNFAIMSLIGPWVDLAFVDESAHFCLRESLRWCDNLKHPPIDFRNRDTGQLAASLKEHCQKGMRPIVLTDGVFATRGDLAPLAAYREMLAAYDGSMILVDDAHGIAAMGENGRGSLEVAGIDSREVNCTLDDDRISGPRVFCSATLSKAVGGHGGVIAGSRDFIQRLRKTGGWCRGASAPASPVAGATAKALTIAMGKPTLRRQLLQNVTQLRTGLQNMGVPVEATPSPVVGFSLGNAELMRSIRDNLLDYGIVIAYSADYVGAGPDGTLRIAVFASHTRAMIERLLTQFQRAWTAAKESRA